jgi:hypothetical protein
MLALSKRAFHDVEEVRSPILGKPADIDPISPGISCGRIFTYGNSTINSFRTFKGPFPTLAVHGGLKKFRVTSLFSLNCGSPLSMPIRKFDVG